MTGIERIIAEVRGDKVLSPITKQVLVNRLSFEPTIREIERARAQVMGRAAAAASS